MSEYAGCKEGNHCWDRLGSIGYNQTDGTTIEEDTERCRHCPARRIRRVTTKTTSTVLQDTGWKNEGSTGG